MDEYRLTLIVPCYGRPLRTRRMIYNILNQSITNWEAFVIGDGCPLFQKMIDSGEAESFMKKAEENGNKLHCYNLDQNYGYWGGPIFDYCINLSKGKYVIFAGNDDIIELNHFEHYLSEIENTDYDLVYYKSYIDPNDSIRNPSLQIGSVGHSELIIKKSCIGDSKHDRVYACDWSFLSKLLNKGISTKKAESNKTTYKVMHIPGMFNKDKID